MCDIPPIDLRQWLAFGHPGATFPQTFASGRPGLALAVLSVVERRLDAVRAVLDDVGVTVGRGNDPGFPVAGLHGQGGV